MPSTRSIHSVDGSGSQQPISPLRSPASYANASCAPFLRTHPSVEGEPSPVCGNQNDEIRRNQGCPLGVPACASNHDQPTEKFTSLYATNMPYAACPISSLADNPPTLRASHVSACSSAYSQAGSPSNAGKNRKHRNPRALSIG
jgi:hypothetical protein